MSRIVNEYANFGVYIILFCQENEWTVYATKMNLTYIMQSEISQIQNNVD